MRSRVAIVGGGIAGLSLAAALDPGRFEVVVHESQPERAVAGAALGLWPSAVRALKKIGAYDRLAESGARPSGGYLHDIAGRPRIKARGVEPLMVPRPLLLDALSASVPSTMRLETTEVADAATLDADIVVGADGVRSVVRRLIEPGAADRVETPWVTLRAIASSAPASIDVGEYWGPNQLFGVVPVAGDRAYWFTAHRSDLGPEPLDPLAVIAEAQRVFADAAPIVRSTLASAGPDTLATRIWVAPPMRRYRRGRYVVIGDAAHAMAPNLGRGACDAIVDAVTLAGALANDRLGLWQARRLPVTQAARAIASIAMRTALADSPLRRRVVGV